MDKLKVSSVDELRAQLAAFPNDVLFRGQTKHYTATDGAVSMPTSILRHGCVPPLTLKWSHYAAFVLRALSGSDGVDFGLHLKQAVLQHYGWRSFFIDVTADPAVAAWFACHTFIEKVHMDGNRDCFDEFVATFHQEAQYVPVESEVFLYGVSQHKLSDHGIKCFNLTKIETRNCRPRFHAQKAWLIGPLRDKVPADCILTCISGPATVFADYAATAGYSKTLDLFPSRDEDPILELLLSVPWEFVGRDTDSPTFARGLRLPEYDYKFIKCHSASNAFFRPFWIADARGDNDSPLARAVFYRTPEEMFYGQPIDNCPLLPNIRAILTKHGSLVIESERILRHPEFHTRAEYLKGVYVRLFDDDTVEVSELTVDHPGSTVAGTVLSMGWYYKIDAAQKWSRYPHPGECPCRNNLRHYHLMWIVANFEDLLAAGQYVERSELDYVHPGATA